MELNKQELALLDVLAVISGATHEELLAKLTASECEESDECCECFDAQSEPEYCDDTCDAVEQPTTVELLVSAVDDVLIKLNVGTLAFENAAEVLQTVEAVKQLEQLRGR